MQTFDAAATRARLPMAPLIAALRTMFIAGCDVPPRQVVGVTADDGSIAGHVLLMPAWQRGAYLGVKVVTVFAGNTARGLPSVHAQYTLFDAATGVPHALLDGAELTTRRTAAVSALAASCLARADASQLLIVGSGRVASCIAQAMACVRPIGRVQVWNHRAPGAVALVAELRSQGFDASVVADLPAAVADAHIVSCATTATQPLVRGAWLQLGTHVDLIGAFTPQMRESDGACFQRARVCVDHAEALDKAGDVLQAIAEGAFAPASLHATLEQMCRHERPGRSDADEITLFKSVGSALQDLAAARLVVEGGGA